MQSHWDKLSTIRVVDAGYLLAGMEPERKWQYAPPLVKNFFNLIREKTGAVVMATMPDERSVITQSEFQSLQAAHGVSSATASRQPAPAQNTTTSAPLLKREARRGYVLALTDGQTHVQFGELAHLIADALWPDAGADDARVTYGCTCVSLDAELVRAVESGTLHVKDPLTFGPHAFPVGNALLSALVTVDDVREFLAGRGLTVETARTQATTPSPAPVVQATETKEKRQDRRLKACIDAGLCFEGYKGRLPDGIGEVADREGIKRQSFSPDVKAALKRRDSPKREGVTVHRT